MQKFRLQIKSMEGAMATESKQQTNLKFLHELKRFTVFLFQMLNNKSLHINLPSHGFNIVLLIEHASLIDRQHRVRCENEHDLRQGPSATLRCQRFIGRRLDNRRRLGTHVGTLLKEYLKQRGVQPPGPEGEGRFCNSNFTGSAVNGVAGSLTAI